MPHSLDIPSYRLLLATRMLPSAPLSVSWHIPRKLRATVPLNPRSVLRDLGGALVGSLLLGTCLVVIIIVSFFEVDVWKISLPFAEETSADDDDDPMYSQIQRAMMSPTEKGPHRKETFNSNARFLTNATPSAQVVDRDWPVSSTQII
ncbi:hypothetical protein F5879DRAFT_988099 [Lentinula edodes]|nr:hypothetical protein F5879DRAFT_988099 [Lentinula edodes]